VARRHHYRTLIEWSGEAGTTSYTAYSRDHALRVAGKPDLALSSDPSFRGNAACYNPEELLVAAVSSCHMLWYLHLCARAGIVVTRYSDEAEGFMLEDAATGGRFERVVLHPHVAIAKGDADKAAQLHDEAHRLCFISNSVNFPVEWQPKIESAGGA
jgi:organic hydroperoxide reductase OsmC/OhrA